MKRRLWIAVFALAAFALLGPYIPVDLFRTRIERALEQGLGRHVDIGSVHVTLFPSPMSGPGFTLDAVTIHEDPRAGIEPFAYVDSLGVSIRWLSLLRGRFELSSLNLGDATINLVKTDPGPWNFQFLLARSEEHTSELQSL